MSQVSWSAAFADLRAIAEATHGLDGQADALGRDKLIRFLGAHAGEDFAAIAPLVNSLCARFGLFPYREAPESGEELDELEALAVELHTSPVSDPEGPFQFTSKQLEVFERLMAGENVVLSAPTSFGKSALLDQLILSRQWNHIVILVPTIALIDETRRRLSRFRNDYAVVTHKSESADGSRVIHVLTQERFLELDDVSVDLFVIDEFYKLSPGQDDVRQGLLNIAWHRLLQTGAQYYLLGPNISRLSDDLRDQLHAQLLVTDFKTVAVNVTDWSGVDYEARTQHLIENRGSMSEPLLIFASAPQRAEKLALDLPADQDLAPLVLEVVQWMADAYDPEWNIVKALRRGIAVHHGALPRSIQRIMVRLFNDGLVRALVCTTTLIEGVNTAARTVVIYDKKIDRRNIDGFTFGNISGRAGRAFRHFVGDVYSYMPIPDDADTIVDIPIDSQSSGASLAALVQLDEDEWTPETRVRLADVLDQDDLSLGAIRSNRGLDPGLQIEAARSLRGAGAQTRGNFAWTGYPTTQQLRSTVKFGFENLLAPSQRRGMNADMLLGKLAALRANPADFHARVEQQMHYKRPDQTRSDIINDVLSFERNWVSFTIPSMLRSVQVIQAEILGDSGLSFGNYEYYASELENAFLAPGLSELDEYGLPVILGVQLLHDLDEQTSISERLGQLLRKFVEFEAELTGAERWIVEDVLAGYFGPQWREPQRAS